MKKWLHFDWYQYLLSNANWRNLVCRIKGHPCGVIWYNPGGDEPDYHCKNCGDELI